MVNEQEKSENVRKRARMKKGSSNMAVRKKADIKRRKKYHKQGKGPRTNTIVWKREKERERDGPCHLKHSLAETR